MVAFTTVEEAVRKTVAARNINTRKEEILITFISWALRSEIGSSELPAQCRKGNATVTSVAVSDGRGARELWKTQRV